MIDPSFSSLQVSKLALNVELDGETDKIEVSSGSVSEGGLSSPSLCSETEPRGFTARENEDAVDEKRPIMMKPA